MRSTAPCNATFLLAAVSREACRRGCRACPRCLPRNRLN